MQGQPHISGVTPGAAIMIATAQPVKGSCSKALGGRELSVGQQRIVRSERLKTGSVCFVPSLFDQCMRDVLRLAATKSDTKEEWGKRLCCFLRSVTQDKRMSADAFVFLCSRKLKMGVEQMGGEVGALLQGEVASLTKNVNGQFIRLFDDLVGRFVKDFQGCLNSHGQVGASESFFRIIHILQRVLSEDVDVTDTQLAYVALSLARRVGSAKCEHGIQSVGSLVFEKLPAKALRKFYEAIERALPRLPSKQKTLRELMDDIRFRQKLGVESELSKEVVAVDNSDIGGILLNAGPQSRPAERSAVPLNA